MGELAVVDASDFESNAQIDKIIWKNAGILSVRAIAERTGLTPDQVLRRKNQLFDEIDELTIAQHRQKLVVDMQRMAHDAQKAAELSSIEFKAGLYNSAMAGIKTVLSQLDKLEKNNTSGVTKLNELRVQELLELMREVVDTSVVQIADAYGLEESDIFEVFNANFAAAAMKRDMND